ncbi:MAG TPA: hypothetical protein DEV93_03460 [Chloroflexi bacterium]|jgi:hypothetical protein|nr:hypothetical protein [Chloroflexota bacterium]
MMLNGLYVLALAAVIMGAVYWIPKAIRHDRLMAALEALDDEELAAALDEFPDLLDRRYGL